METWSKNKLLASFGAYAENASLNQVTGTPLVNVKMKYKRADQRDGSRVKTLRPCLAQGRENPHYQLFLTCT